MQIFGQCISFVGTKTVLRNNS